MDKSDYRNTTYCKSFSDIKEKKEALVKKIRIKSQAKNLHPLVKDTQYKNDYLNVYNYKCSYCGASLLNIGMNCMEVDHFIHEASFTSSTEAGRIENLVLSCFACNRRKSSYLIKGISQMALYPDSNFIKYIFFRDNDYGIKINQRFQNKRIIKEFYEKLAFNSEFRKLDFLLLNIDGLSKNPKAESIKGKLLEIKSKLLSKRNLIDVYK